MVKTSLGEVTNGKLYSYQIDNGTQKEVVCKFEKNLDGTVGFKADGYDRNKELIIDPLIFSTFLGGNGYDSSNSIAIDAVGNAYITGSTSSANFSVTSGAYQTILVGIYSDAFVTKLNSSGSGLLYSTYLGGNTLDISYSIAIDASGNVYVTGFTQGGFPITAGVFQTTFGGGSDAFVSKLNSTGTALLYSTYLGGSNDDFGNSIAIDASGNAFVTGYANTNFPITAGVIQTTFGGGSDAFVSKLNSTGTALLYSTYLGGISDNYGNSIALDASGNAFVTGYTTSTNFPVTPGAYQTTHGGYQDAFVTKLNSTGSSLLYSTYLGGNDDDPGNSISIDASGNVFVTGYTRSLNFPITVGAYQTVFGGSFDAFVTKLNSTGTGLLYSTYLGGSSFDQGYSIAVDAGGNAFVTGYTHSTNFPITAGAFQTTNGGNQDVFVTKLYLDPQVPVELTSFSANLTATSVLVKWNTATELNNYGFEIEKKNANSTEFVKAGFVAGAGNSTLPKSYTFTDYKLSKGKTVYRLKQIDTDGSFKYSSEVEVTAMPTVFSLSQNYPNPFNPETIIQYTLPKNANVKVIVYNTLGEEVTKLVDGIQASNFYEVKFNAKGFASGVYFYKIECNAVDGRENFHSIKKMVVLK